MQYNVSFLIKNGIINLDCSIPGFNVQLAECKKIIQYILSIINNPLFKVDKNYFLTDYKVVQSYQGCLIQNIQLNKKKGEIHPYESAMYIVKENIKLFN